jgi:hypothetical protein
MHVTLKGQAATYSHVTKRRPGLLAGAQHQLQLAEALGYGNKQEYENLYAELGSIEDRTSFGKSGTGFFDLIKVYVVKSYRLIVG